MITLIITQKGHYLELPGVSPFRTPAQVNISHVSIPLIVSRLKASGIEKFEIVSDTKGKEEVLTQNDFVVKKSVKVKKEKENYEARFNKLESLIAKLVDTQVSNISENKEQITNRLNGIEKLLKNQTTKVVHVEEKTKKSTSPVKKELKEEDEIFIPSIEIDSLEMKGKTSKETVTQDKGDIDDSVDLLTRIIQTGE
jgi:hypothetical protein